MVFTIFKYIKYVIFVEWFPNDLATAHVTMQYNIAVCQTIRGQLDEAKELVKHLFQMRNKCEVPGPIMMLVLYIELKLGECKLF